MTNSGITIVISLGAIHWFIAESLWTKAKTKRGYKIYGPPRGLRALYSVGIPLFLYGAVDNYVRNPGERWVSAGLLVGALLAAYFFPATILVSSEKVISRQWFGARKKEMQWSQVECVYADPEHQSVIVQDKEQNQIIHTILNVDRAGFLEQIYDLPPQLLSRITLQL